ncbi:MAG: hypothetical protein NT062_22865 [Proteobacteria bacterium]|nr:hypothetical protein [Pseudomonadota bacterium]
MATPMVFRLQGAVVADRYEVGASIPGARLAYDGTDQRGGTPVTITMLLEPPVRDAAAFARLQALVHPQLARVIDVGVHDGTAFVVSEGGGFSLADELRAGPIAAARILAILAAVCDGLAALHAQQLTHGALTTAAVLVGHPRASDDTDVDAVKLSNPQLALGASPGTAADDVAAGRALLRELNERDPIAPLAALATVEVASAVELASQCRATLAGLSPAQRVATSTRPAPVGPPAPPMPTNIPMPTNWSPPPPPRDFVYAPPTIPRAIISASPPIVVATPRPAWPRVVAAVVVVAVVVVALVLALVLRR